MDEDVAEFARTFNEFLGSMSRVAAVDRVSPVRALIDGHLGEGSAMFPIVAEGFPNYDHVNVQVALRAYLAGEGREHELVGLAGQQRRWMSLADLMQSAHETGVALGPVDLVNLPVGPQDTRACVGFGLFLVRDRGSNVVVLMRGPNEQSGEAEVKLEVVGPDQDASRALLSEIRRLMVELNVFRGQMISFGESRMGHVMLGPIVFHRRPELERDQIVMPEGLLEQVERQVFAIAEHRDRLRSAGQHVKRGLLLHGPPGTGKTLTVRYVAGRAREHTIVLLTGGGLGMIRPACSLARMLQPAIVVIEDVDLIAQQRMMYEGGNPLLFDILNEMDGIEEDADVVFILTTNRADLLEPALAARPGRVDLAVEIPLPGEAERRQLIALYARGLDLRLTDEASVVRATAGVTASFVKELVRKASLLAAVESGEGAALVVTDSHVNAALEELLAEGNALTRLLLGGAAAGEPRRPGTEWLTPGTG